MYHIRLFYLELDIVRIYSDFKIGLMVLQIRQHLRKIHRIALRYSKLYDSGMHSRDGKSES